MNKYNIYTTQDFLDDMDFVHFVKYPENNHSNFWNQWRAGDPPNGQDYDEALAYLQTLFQISRLEPSVEFASSLFNEIEIGIATNQNRKKSIRLWTAVSSAAAVLLILGISWYYQSLIVIQTSSGVLKTVVLPDSSVAHLNANSSIAYHRAWEWLSKREVYTTGEVLLEVKHTNKDKSHIKENERFTAYTGDVAVDVLGTKFNLKNRDNQITVSLLDGRISMRNINLSGSTRILEPGDIVIQGPNGFQQLNRSLQKVTHLTSWTHNTLIGENLAIADLIKEFRYLYGKEIVVQDSTLLNNKIDGRISLNSEESIIYTIANILKARIRFEKDTIYLDPKSESNY